MRVCGHCGKELAQGSSCEVLGRGQSVCVWETIFPTVNCMPRFQVPLEFLIGNELQAAFRAAPVAGTQPLQQLSIGNQR